MRLSATPLPGVMLVETTPVEDERGFFARYFCAEEFAAHGIDPAVAQCSISFNKSAFTLRGMHFQTAPHAEQKFIRCTAGAIFDVVVDIRRGSPSFGKWFGAELTAANRRALLAPRGTAHGFLTLQENCEVFYMISTPFAAGAGAGLRWDDPAIGIRWPAPPAVISPRDAAWPAFGDCVS